MKKLILSKLQPIDAGKTLSLSADRTKRQSLLKSPEEQRRFAYAEDRIMRCLARFYGCKSPVISGGAGEKPFLRNADIFFSKSYGEDFVALAFDDAGEIGIDCEAVKPAEKEVLRFFFTEEEAEYVRNSEHPDLAFTLIWTRKESYIKCIGEGLKFPFHTLNTTPAEGCTAAAGSKLFAENQRTGNLYLNSYIAGNTVISVASERNDRFPQIEML